MNNKTKTKQNNFSATVAYSETYEITQHDYTIIQMKLCDIKSMLYCNENPAFIENELDNLSKMLKKAVQKQR